MAPLLRYDALAGDVANTLAAARPEREKMEFVVGEIRRLVPESEDARMMITIYCSWIETHYPRMWEQFRQQYNKIDTVDLVCQQVSRTYKEEQSRIAGISRKWRAWNWTFPRGTTPPKWTCALLKEIRILCAKTDDWRWATAWVAAECLERRARARARRTAHVERQDVKAATDFILQEEAQEREEMEEEERERERGKERERERQQESERYRSPSIEQGRGAARPPLRDESTLLQEDRSEIMDSASEILAVHHASLVMETLRPVAARELQLKARIRAAETKEEVDAAAALLTETIDAASRLMRFMSKSMPESWFSLAQGA